MENKLSATLASGQKGILAIYTTPGFPNLSDTENILKAIQSGGADIIEVGMPYSDPLADGPTIQASSAIALQHGITISGIFKILQSVKDDIHIPIVLMGYFNPVLQYGIETFCKDAHDAGVSGIIIPDVPQHYMGQYFDAYFKKYNIKPIYLITPMTSDQRIRAIDAQSPGFIYAVSSASTTGAAHKSGVNEAYLDRLKALDLNSPVLVGFNIKSAEDHARNSAYVHGSIIGSAFIRAISDTDEPARAAQEFVTTIKKTS